MLVVGRCELDGGMDHGGMLCMVKCKLARPWQYFYRLIKYSTCVTNCLLDQRLVSADKLSGSLPSISCPSNGKNPIDRACVISCISLVLAQNPIPSHLSQYQNVSYQPIYSLIDHLTPLASQIIGMFNPCPNQLHYTLSQNPLLPSHPTCVP